MINESISFRRDFSRVLIVDDNEADALLLRKYLEQVFNDKDLSFDTAPSLADALSCLDNGRFDLITLDLKLPDTIELESVTHLRAKSPHSAIILVSAWEDPEVSKKAVRLGAQDYLVKGQFGDPQKLRWSIESSLERQDSFNRMIDRQQEEMNRGEIKSQILSLTAHDIRSPLVGVISFLDRILDGKMIEGLSDEQKKIFELMQKNCIEVVEMASALADVQRKREQTFQVNLEKTNVEKLIEDVLAVAQGQLSRKSLKVKVNLECAAQHIMLDCFLVKRALQNLVYNAIRHSPENTTLEVRVESTTDRNLFYVIDEGKGIDENLIEEALAGKAASTAESKKGRRGLGLSIVDQIARSHGGRLCAKKGDRKGSVFCMELSNWKNATQ